MHAFGKIRLGERCFTETGLVMDGAINFHEASCFLEFYVSSHNFSQSLQYFTVLHTRTLPQAKNDVSYAWNE